MQNQNAPIQKTPGIWNNTMTEVMEVPAYLDNSTAIYFEEDARLCITSGARTMVLDANKLDYITAGGTRALMGIAKAMHDAEGTVSIRNLHDQARGVFDACGLARYIKDEGARPEVRLSLVA